MFLQSKYRNGRGEFAYMNSTDVIKTLLTTIPTSSGVYKMFGNSGILYIGKAKNLKNRLKSYLKVQEQSVKNQVMISRITSIEYEVVKTEAEALILESSLIKKHKPPFNILLKDGKTNPYIVLSTSHTFPSISIKREKPNKQNEFYGPFGDKNSLYNVINTVCKIFKIRTCSDEKFKSAKRPCLEFEIKRCTAPCVNFISKEDYVKDIKMASSFLSGKIKDVCNFLKQQMLYYSEKEEFEMALKYRDSMLSAQKLLSEEKINFEKLEDVDAIIIIETGGQIGIEVFSVRGGFSYGGNVYFPTKTEGENLEDILSFFIMRHYAEVEVPKNIILNIEIAESKILQEALYLQTQKKTKIFSPKKGLYFDLIDFAKTNLDEKLEKKMLESFKIKENLIELKSLLSLIAVPKRIEIYDNSHTAGTFMLGAMVVAGEEGFIKNEYRKFNVKFEDTKKGDDYGMLKETLKRRFLNEKIKNTLPDLIIIDGGRGQYSSAKAVFEELKVNVPFICMAKGKDRNAGKEWIFFEDKEFQLPFTSPLLYYLQILRDEAHRFAITSHRAKRDKNFVL